MGPIDIELFKGVRRDAIKNASFAGANQTSRTPLGYCLVGSASSQG